MRSFHHQPGATGHVTEPGGAKEVQPSRRQARSQPTGLSVVAEGPPYYRYDYPSTDGTNADANFSEAATARGGSGPAVDQPRKRGRRPSSTLRSEEKRRRHNLCEKKRSQRINAGINALRQMLEQRGQLHARDKGSVLEQAYITIRDLRAFADATHENLHAHPQILERVIQRAEEHIAAHEDEGDAEEERARQEGEEMGEEQ